MWQGLEQIEPSPRPGRPGGLTRKPKTWGCTARTVCPAVSRGTGQSVERPSTCPPLRGPGGLPSLYFDPSLESRPETGCNPHGLPRAFAGRRGFDQTAAGQYQTPASHSTAALRNWGTQTVAAGKRFEGVAARAPATDQRASPWRGPAHRPAAVGSSCSTVGHTGVQEWL